MTKAVDVEVAVIGAGAAGLLGAAVAAERGRSVLLLEKNNKPGVKILMSGGTRCNITQNTDSQGIVRAFGDQGRFLHSALAAMGPEQLVAMFQQEGVATKVESTGKIFPRSDRALDVLNALLNRLHRSGARLALGEAVLAIERIEEGYRLRTDARSIATARVLLTSGGQSYPGCGTTGDGYAWAKQFGHRIVPPRPALVPLTTSADWVRELSGVTIPDVGVRLSTNSAADNKRFKRQSRRGSFLFTHRGVSGPAVLDVSRDFTGLRGDTSAELRCDFIPDQSSSQLEEHWRGLAKRQGKRSCANELSTITPRRLAESIMELSEVPVERTFAELSKVESQRLCLHLKDAPIVLTGSLGFKKAEVTAGGVDLRDVHSKTLESKVAPNLFFAGEVLDLDGPIGGYNFQAAWSTAYLAAQHL